MEAANLRKHCKSVRAWALVDRTDCAQIGKVIGHWSDNPNGAVCTVSLFHYGHEVQTDQAGGGGYDKFAHCLAGMTWNGEKIPYNDIPGFFARHGVNVCEVL